ncbi:hypothetical protein FQR65_LT20420 [Abscondita terminalis]|nr:hypothetical protein FQR65_LT20420 [Abscondita terminalis]
MRIALCEQKPIFVSRKLIGQTKTGVEEPLGLARNANGTGNLDGRGALTACSHQVSQSQHADKKNQAGSAGKLHCKRQAVVLLQLLRYASAVASTAAATNGWQISASIHRQYTISKQRLKQALPENPFFCFDNLSAQAVAT